MRVLKRLPKHRCADLGRSSGADIVVDMSVPDRHLGAMPQPDIGCALQKAQANPKRLLA